MNKTRNRPRISCPCVADWYGRGPERIAEVFDPVLKVGCLINVRRMDNGTLRVDVYRIDKGVDVFVGKAEGGAA